MSKTTAPDKTPSPTGGETKASARSPRAQFAIAGLDMSWKLAVVVLVPLIGGYKLDEKFDTTPLLTLLGFALAMVGTALVLWKVSQSVQMQIPATKKEDK